MFASKGFNKANHLEMTKIPLITVLVLDSLCSFPTFNTGASPLGAAALFLFFIEPLLNVHDTENRPLRR